MSRKKKIYKKKGRIIKNLTRDILKILEGDCETAVGAHAVLKNDKIELEAELFSLDGTHRYYEKETKDIKEFDKIGIQIGNVLKAKSKGNYKK